MIRRSFLTGLASLIAAPAVVHAGGMMQILGVVQPWPRDHRWLGAYCIGTDEVMLRADTLYGRYDAICGRQIDAGFNAPPMPQRPVGIWIPSEKGQRVLDARYQGALDALYGSFGTSAPPDFAMQRHVDLHASQGELRDSSLWKQTGFS